MTHFFQLHAARKGLSRLLTSFVCVLAIVVLVVGPFANIAEATVDPAIQRQIEAAGGYAQQAKTAGDQSGLATTRDAAQAAYNQATGARQSAIETLTAATAAANRMPSGQDKTDTLAALSLAREQVYAISGKAVEDATVALNNLSNRQQQEDLQRQAARDGRAVIAATANSGNAEPTKETAKHPLEICIKDFRMSMCIAGIFYVFFVDLTSPIAYLAGALFDAFAGLSLMGGTYASAIIAKGWVIARDVANMLFVFILVYIAIMLILNLEGTGIARHIATVIGVALLINFSFFFTRAVIDVSNIFARAFYDNIVASAAPSSESFTVSGVKLLGQTAQSITGSADIKSISEKVMAGINPQDLLGNATFKKYLDGQGFLDNLAILLTLFFIFGIVNIILAFIFTMAAIQFLTRIVTLWFAIILSPLAFVTFALPGHRGHHWWEEWLDLLIKNAFYAPAFLFVVYIMVAMLDNNLLTVDMANMLASNVSGGSTSAIQSFLNRVVGVIVRLAVVVGLFYSAIKVGEFLSTHGASTARSWAGKLAVGGNARLVGGLGSFVGRNTIGRAGYALNRSDLVRNVASGRVFSNATLLGRIGNAGMSVVGRGAERATGAAAKASFDARALTGIPGAKLGGDIAGKARAGGLIKALDEKAKALEKEEHDRHDTPEEKFNRERRIAAAKTAIRYDERRAQISEELGNSERYASTMARQLAESIEATRQARESGGAAEIAAAERLESQRRVNDAEAKARVQSHKDRIAELDRQVRAAGGVTDAERKEAFASVIESPKFWPFQGRFAKLNASGTRAAYNIRHGKSKEKKVLDALQEAIGTPPPPPPAPPAGGGAPPPPAAGGGDHH